MSHIAFAQNGATVMTTAKRYDKLNRLLSIPSVPSVSSVVSFNYQYNSANQRTRATLADGICWVYPWSSLIPGLASKHLPLCMHTFAFLDVSRHLSNV